MKKKKRTDNPGNHEPEILWNWNPIQIIALDAHLATAKSKSKKAAAASRVVLGLVCHQYRHAKAVYEPYMEFLVEALEEALRGKNPRLALGLSGPRHRPRDDIKNILTAANVLKLVKGGMKKTEAISLIASKNHKSVEAIRSALKTGGAIASQQLEAGLILPDS